MYRDESLKIFSGGIEKLNSPIARIAASSVTTVATITTFATIPTATSISTTTTTAIVWRWKKKMKTDSYNCAQVNITNQTLIFSRI